MIMLNSGIRSCHNFFVWAFFLVQKFDFKNFIILENAKVALIWVRVPNKG